MANKGRSSAKKKKPAKKKTAKKPAEKKTAKKSPAKKKTTAKRPAKKTASRAAKPAKAKRPAKPAGPAVPPGETPIGQVVHYYSHISVAVIKLKKGALQVGDVIHIKGHTSDFRQVVDSMQVEHQTVTRAAAGDDFGLKVSAHAREHDVVYRVLNP